MLVEDLGGGALQLFVLHRACFEVEQELVSIGHRVIGEEFVLDPQQQRAGTFQIEGVERAPGFVETADVGLLLAAAPDPCALEVGHRRTGRTVGKEAEQPDGVRIGVDFEEPLVVVFACAGENRAVEPAGCTKIGFAAHGAREYRRPDARPQRDDRLVPCRIMAIFPIRTFGDPVLRTVAAEVADIDHGIRRLAEDMIETMYDAPGVGLAAPQIGISKRVFVFDSGDGTGSHVIVNPVLEEASGEWEFDEGCLSVPGRYWPIRRPSYARVSGYDLDGSEVRYEGNDLLGRVLQHEFDHLQGVLLIERLDRRTRKEALRDLRNEALGL